jgi:hypothetical protein
MPMKTRPRPLLAQSDLFQPPPTRPLWRNLPLDMQSRVKELLIQLLQERQNAHAAARRGKEAGHE